MFLLIVNNFMCWYLCIFTMGILYVVCYHWVAYIMYGFVTRYMGIETAVYENLQELII